MALTFQVSDVEVKKYGGKHLSIKDYVKEKYCTGKNDKSTGTLIKIEDESTPKTCIRPELGNGLVGVAFEAYNKHHCLVLRPDDIWIAIGTVFAGYVDRNHERMRSTFVNHEEKVQLVIEGKGGDIYTVDYDDLISQTVSQIKENTKKKIREWMECDFSTTTSTTLAVSQLILMSSMKNYFSYTWFLKCNLPRVTLEGERVDWIKIQERIKFLRSFEKETVLHKWADVLEHVIQYFIDAFDEKVDGKTDSSGFWNRIATQTGGGSGPSYLEGWILAFYPFDDKGKYCLNSLANIRKGKRFGKINTNNISPGVVSVPVIFIEGCGRIYQTEIITGFLSGQTSDKERSLQPNVGWALIDVTVYP